MTAKVLIAEDEQNIAIALEYLMQREGYEVERVETGTEALERARAMHPDIILLDVMLPGRDGYDVCQTLRMDDATSQPKILMMTAKGGRNEREKGLAFGADDFIAKPFSTADLAARVRALLGGAG